jgi:S-adenosylmethionine decarboxylase
VPEQPHAFVAGVHSLLEMYGCPADVLDDLEAVRAAMHAGVEASRGTLLGECAHDFEPQGVTVVGLLAESHISIHTWPEHGYAAADVFTCGTAGSPEIACIVIAQRLGATHHEIKTISRGAPGSLGSTPSDG